MILVIRLVVNLLFVGFVHPALEGVDLLVGAGERVRRPLGPSLRVTYTIVTFPSTRSFSSESAGSVVVVL